MKSKSSDAVVALFCGAGGLSLGFTQAGVSPKLSADIDQDACSTYRTNLGDSVLNVDLSEKHDAFDRELNGCTGAFALIGGPPCQGFSSAGLKDATDKRNRLIFNYFRVVDRLRPRWFIFENVEGLLTSNSGQSVKDLVQEFVRAGYRTRLEKVNFASYGLPQARKRVLIVGNRLGIDFELPASITSFDAGKHKCKGTLPAAPTLDEALAGLGVPTAELEAISTYSQVQPVTAYDKLMRSTNRGGGTTLHNVTASERLSALLVNLKQGETMKDLPEEYWHDSFRRRANRRVADGTPTEHRGGAPTGVKRLLGSLNSLTITSAATREFIHPHQDRPLTLREAARLQSFPDSFEFAGGANSIARQIGNAFPPLAARRLAEHLAQLDGRFGGGRSEPASLKPGALIGFRLTDATGMSPALTNTAALLVALQTEQQAFQFEPDDRAVA